MEGYYQYDPRGSVSGITSEEGVLRTSYRYNPFGGISFGSPQYNNVYAYNGEDYNPNTEFQYLRARYYDTKTGAFVSEDSWLGETTNPLTLNRYSYVLNNPLNYQDPSGNVADTIWDIGGFLGSVYDYLKDPTSQNRNAVLVDEAFALAPLVPNPQITKAKNWIAKFFRGKNSGNKKNINTNLLKELAESGEAYGTNGFIVSFYTIS